MHNSIELVLILIIVIIIPVLYVEGVFERLKYSETFEKIREWIRRRNGV